MRSARVLKRTQERRAMFGSFGAILSETHLRDEAAEKDPQRDKQRRGDSDVDWGDESESQAQPDAALEELSSGLGGMDLDSDLDLQAMKTFVNGMSASGSLHVTMDDLADGDRIREEDEDDSEDGDSQLFDTDTSSTDELDAAIAAVESAFVTDNVDEDNSYKNDVEEGGRSEDEDEDEDESEDESSDEETPRRGFQARLQQLRKRAQGRPIIDVLNEALDEDSDNIFPGFIFHDDDDLVDHIQVLVLFSDASNYRTDLL